MKCPQCGLVTFDDLPECPRCKESFALVKPLAASSLDGARHMLRDDPELRLKLRDRLHRARLDRRKENENPLATGPDPDAPDWFEPDLGDDSDDVDVDQVVRAGERSKESTVVQDDLSPDNDVRAGAATADADSEADIIEASREFDDEDEPQFSGEIPGFTDWREELRERLKRIRARREAEAAAAEDEEAATAEAAEEVEAAEEPAAEVDAVEEVEEPAAEPDAVEEIEEPAAELEEAEDPEEPAAELEEAEDLEKPAAEVEESEHAIAAAPTTAGDIIAQIIDGPAARDDESADIDFTMPGAAPVVDLDLDDAAGDDTPVIDLALDADADDDTATIDLDLNADTDDDTATIDLDLDAGGAAGGGLILGEKHVSPAAPADDDDGDMVFDLDDGEPATEDAEVPDIILDQDPSELGEVQPFEAVAPPETHATETAESAQEAEEAHGEPEEIEEPEAAFWPESDEPADDIEEQGAVLELVEPDPADEGEELETAGAQVEDDTPQLQAEEPDAEEDAAEPQAEDPFAEEESPDLQLVEPSDEEPDADLQLVEPSDEESDAVEPLEIVAEEAERQDGVEELDEIFTEAGDEPELDFEDVPAAAAPPAPEIDLPEPEEDVEKHALEWDEEEELAAPAALSTAAPLGERAAAAVADALVLTAIATALVGAASSGAGVPFRQILTQEALWVGLAWAIFAVGYSVFFVGSCGQTIGRMVMRVRVIGDDQFSVGFDRAAKRLGFWVISALPALAGMLPALRDPQKRALHDRLSRTRIVKA